MTPHFQSNALYQVSKFASGELQVTLTGIISEGVEGNVTIKGSILSSDNLMELLLLVEAIRNSSPLQPIVLEMPYCAYSRQDRRCTNGEALSSKVFAQLINSCNFYRVVTVDNHSYVSTALIDRCYDIPAADILTNAAVAGTLPMYEYAYAVSPDAGALKKVQVCCNAIFLKMLRADKLRSLTNGTISDTIIHLPPNTSLKNTKVLIIDDICQGGRTFIELAKAIKAIEPTCEVHLYVSHGFFDRGLDDMIAAGISHFYTTDSVCTLQHRQLTML